MNTLYLETQVNISRDCASFYFQDITPEYNQLTNPNGYDPTGVNCVDPANIDSNAITVQITNLANPTSPVTVNIPDINPIFDETRIPGVVQYNITNTSFTSISYTVSNAVGTGALVTYTTSIAHTFIAGQTVTITSLIPTQFNITGVITSVPNNTSFTIANVATGSASNTGTVSGQSLITGDGVYKFVYTIIDSANNDQVYQRTCYVLNDCAICCELDQRLKDLKECGSCSDKNNRTVNMLYEAYMLKQKAHHLVACHDFDGAQQVLDYLSRLLDIKYCDSCNNNS